MEDINKKIEEFENKYGMCELSVDDLDNVGGGAGIGLNSQDRLQAVLPVPFPSPASLSDNTLLMCFVKRECPAALSFVFHSIFYSSNVIGHKTNSCSVSLHFPELCE